MTNLKDKTKSALAELRKFLENSPWREEFVMLTRELEARLDSPCVLAVAGRVKAGKSSFINAFLRDDLALVGNTETTATINYFRYGEAPDKEKPVKCVWLNGDETWESREFLDSLQGNTDAALERANGIKHLEFYLPNPRLRTIQLVDTPGTGAIVGEDGEGHERRTAGFFNMQTALRDRHSAETEQISREADAVIYLMGYNAAAQDADFLRDFMGTGAVHAYNTFGIMAKTDLSDELLQDRQHYVELMEKQLKEHLPLPMRVLPISAGIQRALDELSDEKLEAMRQNIRNGFAPGRLVFALSNERIYKMPSLPGCTLSLDERLNLRGGIPWRCFVLIARALQENEVQEARRRLSSIAGFDDVGRILESQFFQRGMTLRCNTVLQDSCKLLWTLLHEKLYQYTDKVNVQTKEAAEFIDFIMSHPAYSEKGIGGRFRRFIDKNIERDRSDMYRSELIRLNELFQNLLHGEVKNCTMRFEGLLQLEEHRNCVSDTEAAELVRLFSMSPETNDRKFLASRQSYWHMLVFSARTIERKQLAHTAELQYGVLISQMNSKTT